MQTQQFHYNAKGLLEKVFAPHLIRYVLLYIISLKLLLFIVFMRLLFAHSQAERDCQGTILRIWRSLSQSYASVSVEEISMNLCTHDLVCALIIEPKKIKYIHQDQGYVSCSSLFLMIFWSETYNVHPRRTLCFTFQAGHYIMIEVLQFKL